MQNERRRLFENVVLHVKDLDQSKKFYRAVVETLGHTITKETKEQFFIEELEIRQSSETTKSIQLAFKAEHPGLVKLFHETALRHGGRSLSEPDATEVDSLTAHVIDPDGNDVRAIYRLRSQKTNTISY